MSLINDALKRASQAKPSPPPSRDPEPPMHPVEYQRRSVLPRILFLALVAVVLGLASWFFVTGWQAQRAAHPFATEVPIAARQLTAEPPRSGPEQMPSQFVLPA